MFFFALLFFTKRCAKWTSRLGLFSTCKREAKNAGGCGGFFARWNEARWRGVLGRLFFT